MTHGRRLRGVCLATGLLVAGCTAGPSSDPVAPVANGRSDGAPDPSAEAGATPGETAPAPPPLADAATPETGPPPPPPPPPPPAPDAPTATGLERYLPRPTGPCPDFAPGMLSLRAGGITREARLWSDPARRGGPLVLYWYGTNGSPAQAEQALGAEAIAAITAEGGVVLAPVHDPTAGMWPWHLVTGRSDRDLLLADELVACAIAKAGIDPRRIHAVGFSAGAIHVVQMSYRRSGYLASVVTYSGAQVADIPDQDPGNKLGAMIFHGGPNDRVIIGFQAGSEAYRDRLRAAGRFALLCNHGLGHRVPQDARASAWRFLAAHRHGAPSPYAAMLPAGVPDYCARERTFREETP